MAIVGVHGGGVGGVGRGVPRPSVPVYRAPTYDIERVRELTQEQLQPAVGELRRAIQSVQAGRYRTPVARREALRGVTRGVGDALTSAQARATQIASRLYEPEFAARTEEAKERYRRDLIEEERAREERLLEEERSRMEREKRERDLELKREAAKIKREAAFGPRLKREVVGREASARRIMEYSPFRTGGTRTRTTGVGDTATDYTSALTRGL